MANPAPAHAVQCRASAAVISTTDSVPPGSVGWWGISQECSELETSSPSLQVPREEEINRSLSFLLLFHKHTLGLKQDTTTMYILEPSVAVASGEVLILRTIKHS